MAEQFYAAVNHSFNTAQYPVPTANLPDGPPLLSNSHVKQETSYTNQHHRSGSGTKVGRPKKRQKTGEEQARNGHKFVSQKKWKFSDAQPWLPSKTSSKAQNASKASTKYQHRSASPKRSTSPQKSLVVGKVPSASTSTKSSDIQFTPQYVVDRENAPTVIPTRETVSQGGHRRDGQESPSRQIRRSIEEAPVFIRSFSQQEESPRDGGHGRELSGEVESTKSCNGSRAASDTPRPSRPPHTLSLEKDAARIAALIAEKRKENESSLFRERMLRKQFEHRTHKDSGNSAVASSNVTTSVDVPESRVSSSPFSDGESLHVPAEGSPSTVASASSPDMPNSSRTIEENQETHPNVRVRKPVAQRNGLAKVRSSRDDMNEKHVETTPAATKETPAADAINRTTSPDGMLNYFGKEQRPEIPLNTGRFEMSNVQSSSYLEPHGRSAPFEVEDADVAAQFVAFTNQFLQRKPTPKEQLPASTLPRQPHPTFYQRQSSSSSLPVHSQRLPQSNLTVSSMMPNRNHLPAKLAQQSARLASSHSPNEMPARQNLPPDVLPSQHSPTRPASHSVPVAGAPNDSSRFQPIAYRTMNQQSFVTSSRQGPHPETVGHVTYPTPVSQQTIANTSGTSMLLQQCLPQPPVLASNVNMFSGEARSNGGNGMGPPAPKPRVNMFGNTKGSPFTMHEVIRQIEMT